VDGSKALYIVEGRETKYLESVIRRVDLKTSIITTVRTATKLTPIDSLALDNNGTLLATEFTEDRICRIDPISGSVTTIAGGNQIDFSGDEGPAIDAEFEYPNSVAVDREGNLFIAQYGYGNESHRIRSVDAKTGIITTVAGLGKAGFAPDGESSLSASLQSPSDLLFDRMGNLYLIDNGRVRYVDAATKRMKTVAGSTSGFSGDGGPAIRAGLDASAIALDSEGNLYIADFGATECGEWMRGPGSSRQWPATGSRTGTACCSERARQGLASNSSSARFSGVSLA
jgi:hypothetical protein